MKRRSTRALLRQFRKAGGTFEQACSATYDAVPAGPRMARMATLADVLQDLAAVYGKRRVRAKYGKNSV